MKLQKQKSYKHNEKQYYKYVVVIPMRLIKKLDWQNVKELKGIVTAEQLIIEKV